MKQFTNQYQLSKTLRFELIPQGNTLKYIEAKGLLTKDEERATNYKEVKKLIDKYHKAFIDEALQGLIIKHIEQFNELYYKKERTDIEKKELENLQKAMRKQVAESFTKNPNAAITKKFQNLDKKELIKEDLLAFVSEGDKALVNEFKDFTTYFSGFNTNRKNMYSADDKSTAISYRLIHENLPKFLTNKKIFEKIKEQHSELLVSIKAEIEPHLYGVVLEDMFAFDYFNSTLRQTDIDLYNLMIGGKTDKEKNMKIQGVNEKINLYRQENSLKKSDIPNLAVLYKQILSDRETESWLPEQFENDTELLNSIQSYMEHELLHWQNNDNAVNVIDQLQKHFANYEDYNTSKIYIKNDTSLTNVSKQLFGDWSVISTALDRHYEDKNPQPKKTKATEEKKEKYFKGKQYFTIAEIQNALSFYATENEGINKMLQKDCIFNYFNSWNENKEANNLFTILQEAHKNAATLLNSEYATDKKLAQDKAAVNTIKTLLDSILAVLHFVKPLHASKLEAEKDEAFYNEFSELYTQLEKLTTLYDKSRNYLTQKPYSLEKFKLNFENSTLLDGWDTNKEEANTSILFKKGSLFYLGIMDKNHNKIFRKTSKANTTDIYEKVNYKLLPGASKMLPKVFFSNKSIAYYNPSEAILNIRNHGSHTKNGQPQDGFEKKAFNIDDCRAMIDFYKISIEKHEEWKMFGFQFSRTGDYLAIDEFYKDVESQGYGISYSNIDKVYIDKMVDEGKLYLFQIYNKDFSPYSKGTPNMHTMYWKMLFNEQNLKDVVYKLNGQAEVFFRKKSITNNVVTHKAKEILKNKNEQNKKRESSFEYDIIKDKRFTIDKFQFHVPITMNFKATGNDRINNEVNTYLKNKADITIIGIDRGERHLLYLSLIDSNGTIIEQYSLNDIVNNYKGNTYTTNYQNKLAEREAERAKARTSWQSIETIKELKEGYISQVVHKIATLMVQHKAIVVMEDLNFGFKRGRFKVEKQVYQKFEKMLIDKLNYLVFKNNQPEEKGGVLKAYQLTNKFTSFKDMGKQCGFIFYVPAWNTSKIDPTTGFVNLFYTKYENEEKSKAFFKLFKKISFNTIKNYFEFEFDYNDFTSKAEDTKTEWTVCTYKDRILTFRNEQKNNEWDNKPVVLTDEFITLFHKYNIDYKSDQLQNNIINQTQKQFFVDLYRLLSLTLQMRNSITNSNIDYLISPVAKEGVFFDSRNQLKHLPLDVDANGAYHIAKKGLWVVEQIKKTPDLTKLKLAISNKDWLAFVQQ